MSTQLAQQQPSRDLKGLLNSDSMKQQFANALPKHLKPERFIRVATTALMRVPNLAACTPESFMKCMLDLSAWGIEPDGRRAHLIPFKNNRSGTYECTLILDWKGLAELALRSGMIGKLHADVVCENDVFGYNLGEITAHVIDFRKPRGEPYAAFALATTKDGATFVAVMSKEEIEKIRDNSQGYKSAIQYNKTNPWISDPGEMWKKTAFRRLSKLLPLSAEFRDAASKEDEEYDPQIRDVTPRPAGPIALESNPFDRLPNPATTEEAPPFDDLPATGPAPEPAPAEPAGNVLVGYFEKFETQESKPGAAKPWKLWRVHYCIAGGAFKQATTFSATIGEYLEWLSEEDKIEIEVETGEKGDTIKGICKVEGGAA
jgi:recombination protein RecT